MLLRRLASFIRPASRLPISGASPGSEPLAGTVAAELPKRQSISGCSSAVVGAGISCITVINWGRRTGIGKPPQPGTKTTE
jgi:hypothetical protein